MRICGYAHPSITSIAAVPSTQAIRVSVFAEGLIFTNCVRLHTHMTPIRSIVRYSSCLLRQEREVRLFVRARYISLNVHIALVVGGDGLGELTARREGEMMAFRALLLSFVILTGGGLFQRCYSGVACLVAMIAVVLLCVGIYGLLFVECDRSDRCLRRSSQKRGIRE